MMMVLNTLQDFNVLTWPSQSRDLNPIEHVWTLMKRKLNKYPTPAKGMLRLWERVCNLLSIPPILSNVKSPIIPLPIVFEFFVTSKKSGKIIDFYVDIITKLSQRV